MTLTPKEKEIYEWLREEVIHNLTVDCGTARDFQNIGRSKLIVEFGSYMKAERLREA